MTMQPPVVIGDAASQTRAIDPTDYAIGWKVAGAAGDAVSLDSWEVLINQRLRPLIEAIILAVAPTGLTLSGIVIDPPMNLRLDYMVAGHAAHLSVDLSTLFLTMGTPSNIAVTADHGSDDGLTHPDHAHRLPSRAQGEAPVVGLDQIASAPPVGFGMRLGFRATDGEPEFLPETVGALLSTDDPVAVGAAGAPTSGSDPSGTPIDHIHELADRVVTLMNVAAVIDPADFGKVIGFDPTTGVPTLLDPGGGTFLSQTDTPMAFGTQGQAPVVDTAGTALEFAGPFQLLAAPSPPTNVRTTDAFDGYLENAWAADPDAAAYEYQRKASSAPWPPGDGTRITAISVRNMTLLALGDYDFRVRAVSPGGHLRSSWIELLNIPVITTPTPATSTIHRLSRVRSLTLSFAWSDLDVDNGGSGQTRVVKDARYEYQYREVGQAWGVVVQHTDHTGHEIDGLTDGTFYEARVQGIVRRSDGSMSEITGAYSGASNQEKPVKTTVTLTYGVAPTRTGAISSPRTLELTPGVGRQIEITNALNPAQSGDYYALDIDRGAQYARNYNIVALETRPLPSDITMGADYVEEMEPATGPRRYSIGPAIAINSTQIWLVEVN